MSSEQFTCGNLYVKWAVHLWQLICQVSSSPVVTYMSSEQFTCGNLYVKWAVHLWQLICQVSSSPVATYMSSEKFTCGNFRTQINVYRGHFHIQQSFVICPPEKSKEFKVFLLFPRVPSVVNFIQSIFVLKFIVELSDFKHIYL
jgi:hypothetical protein